MVKNDSLYQALSLAFERVPHNWEYTFTVDSVNDVVLLDPLDELIGFVGYSKYQGIPTLTLMNLVLGSFNKGKDCGEALQNPMS